MSFVGQVHKEHRSSPPNWPDHNCCLVFSGWKGVGVGRCHAFKRRQHAYEGALGFWQGLFGFCLVSGLMPPSPKLPPYITISLWRPGFIAEVATELRMVSLKQGSLGFGEPHKGGRSRSLDHPYSRKGGVSESRPPVWVVVQILVLTFISDAREGFG